LSKIGLLILIASALVTGDSFAAGKITLTCTGTMTNMRIPPPGHTFEKSAIPDESFVVDLDNGIVVTRLGELAVTESTQSYVAFEGDSKLGRAKGRIDRISGSAFVTVLKNSQPLFVSEFVCKPAKPLF
jgi:hypothetical protein